MNTDIDDGKKNYHFACLGGLENQGLQRVCKKVHRCVKKYTVILLTNVNRQIYADR
jgi:hypothetical protein